MEEQGVDIGTIVNKSAADSVSSESLMDIILERLKILNYETSFCGVYNYKMISPAQFIVAANNTATQFQLFRDLCKWLFFQLRKDVSLSESDDPDTIITKIMTAIKQLGFQVSFPPQKLKSPYGQPTCMVLDFLTEEALKAINFHIKEARFEPDIVREPEILEPAAEEEEERRDEEMNYYQEETKHTDTQDYSYYEEMNPYQWKAELDRVTPRLKMPNYPLGKEWRTHLEQSSENMEVIKKIQNESGKALSNLGVELERQLEIIGQKEKTLNVQYTNIAKDYQSINRDLSEKRKDVRSLEEMITNYENDNSIVKQRLSELKDIMGTGKGKQGDTAPIVKIKKAITSVKKDIYSLNTQIGVVAHAINHARARTNEEFDDLVGVNIEEEDSYIMMNSEEMNSYDSSDY